MDKETLSNYGWIVICVLVLAVMIALATPFGEFIKDAVWSTTNGLFDVGNNALSTIAPPVDYDKIMRSINHRGYNSIAPENTIPAYALSKENGFKYVEADVRFTSDGIPVLLHDVSINRTARNADGSQLTETINIADITYEEALTYDFGVWKGSSYAGTKIPTLEEFLSFCATNNLYPYLDVQMNGLTKEQAKQIADLVKQYRISNITYISNSSKYLNYFNEFTPTARLGLLIWKQELLDTHIESIQALQSDNNEVFLDADYTQMNIDTTVAVCKEAKIPLEVYGLSTPVQIQLLDPYITGVTTDSMLAGKIIHENKPVLLDYEVVKVLSSDDIQYRVGTSPNSPYKQNNKYRASYVEFDIILEEGYTYKFEFDSTIDTTEMGCQFALESVDNLVSNNESVKTHIVDSGWQSSGYVHKVNYATNPIKYVRFTFRINEAEITEAFINSVTISRKSTI